MPDNAGASVRSANPQRILITGASGFIGSCAVAHFLRRGFLVRAHRRAPAAPKQPAAGQTAPGLPAEEVSGGLESLAPVEQALDGVDILFHTAGLAHARGPSREELRRVNVEWPQLLAREAAKRRIRFVHLSTSKVYGESGSFSESSPLSPGDDYAKAKVAAETAVLEADPEALIFRMPPVYGPGSKGSFRALVNAVRRGWPLPLGRLNAKRSYLFAGVLFEAAEFLLARSERGIWNVTDDHDIALCDLVREIAHAMNQKALLVPVPAAVLRALLAVRPGLFEKLAGSFTLDVSRLLGLGFRSSVIFEEGLRAAALPGNLL